MKKRLQIGIQVLFLILFIFLLIIGKPQLWMGLFLVGVVASFFWGRVYCGWVCSINTVLRGVTWIKKKLRIKSSEIPEFLTKPWVRFSALGLFGAVFVLTIVTGKKLPVLPFLFALGVILTFIYPEELWHRYLCPYGTILSFPGSKSTHYLSVDENLCNNCGACKRVCPAAAILKHENHHEIIKSDCLLCLDCTRVCRQDAISYSTEKSTSVSLPLET